MRIAFVSTNLGAGTGGVADYVAALAREVRGERCRPFLLAIADPGVGWPETGEEDGIASLRLPRSDPWATRVAAAQKVLAEFRPDWVSLQFVCYGFNPKGVILREGPWLSRLLRPWPLQVMMHELWVGPLPGPASAKLKAVRWLQRWSILALLRSTAPRLVHTSNSVYRELLAEAGIEAGILTLFGNFPVRADADRGWLEARIAEAIRERGALEPLRLGFFGGVAPEWDPRPVFARIAAAATSVGRMPIILSGGRSGDIAARMEGWRRAFPDLRFLALGALTGEQVSAYLQGLDFGLTSYPYALLGKSSSAAAMFEHGVPLIAAWGDVRPDLAPVSGDVADLALPPTADLARLFAYPPPKSPRPSRLPEVAHRLIADLDRADLSLERDMRPAVLG